MRIVSVTDLLVLGIPRKYLRGLDEPHSQRLFPLGCPVVYNFHGYTAATKQLLWERLHNDATISSSKRRRKSPRRIRNERRLAEHRRFIREKCNWARRS